MAGSARRGVNRYEGVLIGPHQVSLDVTNRCNLRCLHCYNSSGENAVSQDELTDGEALSFLRDVASMRPFGFCFCGGETLLRLDLVCEGIALLKEADVSSALVTNGILLTLDALSRLVEAGLGSIQFSLDGMAASHDRMRGRPGAFDAATAALGEVLRSTDLQVSVAFCPTSFNTGELPELYSALVAAYRDSGRSGRLDIGDRIELRVQPLMLLGRARSNPGIRPTEDQYRRLVADIARLKLREGLESIEIRWGDPVDHLLRFTNPEMLLDQATVRANGDIAVSPYMPLVVGNVRRHPLTEYWAAGLPDVWDTGLVRALADRMYSIEGMERVSESIADVCMGGDIRADIIEGADLDDLSALEAAEGLKLTCRDPVVRR